ncbi:MAG: hypothetical protein AAFZ01_00595 [Pseudomonadota bacterium]
MALDGRLDGAVFGITYSRDACAEYLADHIDEALALAEQIATAELPPIRLTVTEDAEHDGTWVMGGDEIFSRFAEIRSYVAQLRALELALTTRISQARVWAERVRRYDPRLDRVAELLLAGTHAFVDAGARTADTTNRDFATADPALAWLKKRGLVARDCVSLDDVGAITPGYRFAIFGGVPLFDLAELLHAMQSAADVHYNLYEPNAEDMSDADAAQAAPVEAGGGAGQFIDAFETSDDLADDPSDETDVSDALDSDDELQASDETAVGARVSVPDDAKTNANDLDASDLTDDDIDDPLAADADEDIDNDGDDPDLVAGDDETVDTVVARSQGEAADDIADENAKTDSGDAEGAEDATRDVTSLASPVHVMGAIKPEPDAETTGAHAEN